MPVENAQRTAPADWLRGEAGPGPEEDPGVGDAVGRTARRLLLRVAGLPLMRVEGKSPKFRVR
jgi:hypothetical protein